MSRAASLRNSCQKTPAPATQASADTITVAAAAAAAAEGTGTSVATAAPSAAARKAGVAPKWSPTLTPGLAASGKGCPDQHKRSISSGIKSCGIVLEGPGTSPEASTLSNLDADAALDVATEGTSNSSSGGGGSKASKNSLNSTTPADRVPADVSQPAWTDPRKIESQQQACVLRPPTARAVAAAGVATGTERGAAAATSTKPGWQLPPRPPKAHSRGPSWGDKEMTISLGLSPRSNSATEPGCSDSSSFWGCASEGLASPVLSWSPPTSPVGKRGSLGGTEAACSSRGLEGGRSGERGAGGSADEELVVASLDGTWLQASGTGVKSSVSSACKGAAAVGGSSGIYRPQQQHEEQRHQKGGCSSVDKRDDWISEPCGSKGGVGASSRAVRSRGPRGVLLQLLRWPFRPADSGTSCSSCRSSIVCSSVGSLAALSNSREMGHHGSGRASWGGVRRHSLGLRLGPDDCERGAACAARAAGLVHGSLRMPRQSLVLERSEESCQACAVRRVKKVCVRVVVPAAAAGLVTFGGLSTVAAVRRRKGRMEEVGTPLV